MKLLIILSLTTLFAFAHNHEEVEGKAAKFNEMKSRALQNIDKRISEMQAHKSCISSATDRESMKACKKAMKANRKEWRQNKKARKEARKQKKQQ